MNEPLDINGPSVMLIPEKSAQCWVLKANDFCLFLLSCAPLGQGLFVSMSGLLEHLSG